MDKDLDVLAYIDFEDLDLATDSEELLRRELGLRKVEVESITQQLRDDADQGFGRDPEWRVRARDARSHISREIKLLQAELTTRHVKRVEKEKADRVARVAARQAESNQAKDRHLQIAKEAADTRARAAEAHRQATAAQAASAEQRRLARVEMHRISQEKTSQQHSLFVLASKEVLTLEQRLAVWERAKAMFPGDPAWDRSPAPPAVEGVGDGG